MISESPPLASGPPPLGEDTVSINIINVNGNIDASISDRDNDNDNITDNRLLYADNNQSPSENVIIDDRHDCESEGTVIKINDDDNNSTTIIDNNNNNNILSISSSPSPSSIKISNNSNPQNASMKEERSNRRIVIIASTLLVTISAIVALLFIIPMIKNRIAKRPLEATGISPLTQLSVTVNGLEYAPLGSVLSSSSSPSSSFDAGWQMAPDNAESLGVIKNSAFSVWGRRAMVVETGNSYCAVPCPSVSNVDDVDSPFPTPPTQPDFINKNLQASIIISWMIKNPGLLIGLSDNSNNNKMQEYRNWVTMTNTDILIVRDPNGRGDKIPAIDPSISNAVVYKDWIYKSLDNVKPSDPINGCMRLDTFRSLPSGWVIAPNNGDSHRVIGAFNWGTEVMVLADGKGYWTEPLARFDMGNTLRQNNDRYSVSHCNLRILITSKRASILNNGLEYRLLDAVQGDGIDSGSSCISSASIPDGGWQIAPYNQDSINVITNHAWPASVTALVLDNGNAYYTASSSSPFAVPGFLAAQNALSSSPMNVAKQLYGVNECGYRVLLVRDPNGIGDKIPARHPSISNAIIYKDWIYKSLDGVNPSDPLNGCMGENIFLSPPSGWVIAPNNADSRRVIGAFNWGTEVMVVDDGNGYWAKPGAPFDLSGILRRNNNIYAVNHCNLRIIIATKAYD